MLSELVQQFAERFAVDNCDVFFPESEDMFFLQALKYGEQGIACGCKVFRNFGNGGDLYRRSLFRGVI